MHGVGLLFILLVEDASALGFRAQQHKSSSKTVGTISQLMKFLPGFLKASVLDTALSRMCVFGFGRSVPGKDYKLGRRSAGCVSILYIFDVDGPVPEVCPFVLLYFAFCSSRSLVFPVTRK